ncbi:endonuclease/exonuclease/phosphatase family protein [Yoonia litorea]|nr:endonuclease/exonuclease/phosphatase family protein [Yoonia litorea]
MLFAVVVLVGCQTVRHSGNVPLTAPDPDTLRIATYNVHYIILNREEGAWSVADWERRKEPLDLAFKDIAADVIAFQEMESFGGGSISEVNLTLDWLLSQNADYAAAAVGDPRSFPSTQPILYRTARLAVEDQGWFFFSETPDVIYSRTFNGSYPAFASWAAFTDLTNGQSFTVVNVHTDFGSLSNRLQSAALIAERISPWVAAEETVFVVGDLNARLGDEVVDILKETGLNFAPVEGATFHFNRGLNLFAAIDHIASRGAVRLAAPPIVVRQQYNGEWPTDHYPVVADYAWLSTR